MAVLKTCQKFIYVFLPALMCLAVSLDKYREIPCVYSGQQSEHSIYEWCCVEEMSQMVTVVENIIREVAKEKK